jgi:type IV pilus assembly protein PilN
MRITLNLATRPFANLAPVIKRLHIAAGVLTLLSIGLGIGVYAFHQKAEEARAREQSLDTAIARINQERQGYQELMRRPVNAEVLVQASALNQLFDEKAFSWTLAMEDLETVLPGGVQVSTLEPIRDKNGQITLHLRVIGPRDRAVELVRNLEHSRRFLLPSIVGENSETTGGPGERLEPPSASSRVNFDLLAEYNPATASEPRPAPRPEKKLAANPVEISPTRPALLATPNLGPRRPPYTGGLLPGTPGPKPLPGVRP